MDWSTLLCWQIQLKRQTHMDKQNSKPQSRIVVGANWGDEGKGRMVDYFAQSADVVGRFQGGNNAGHTVINDFGEFKLHLLPSGVFNPNTTNVLGPGMVIDLAGLKEELEQLKTKGHTPKLLLSDRATIVLPLHRLEDEWEEDRLGADAYGSTRNGIAYAYADRSAKKGIQVGMLKNLHALRDQLDRWYRWKTPMLKGLYGSVDIPPFEEMYNYLAKLAAYILPVIGCAHTFFQENKAATVVLEAQLGSLRDISFGNYPYTTSSHVLASYASLGSGAFNIKDFTVTAVVKAFSSSVGAGPFPTALDNMNELRETAFEFGARTGRPRDVGHFDAVATRYGIEVQNTDEVALTKLDCLSGTADLKICTAYRLNDERLEAYPLSNDLMMCEPIYEEFTGWYENITSVRKYHDLPAAAQRYVERIEQLIECPIRYISVGPHRDQLIVK